MAELKHDEWKGNTGGQPWMQRSLVKILGAVDQRLVYAIVALVVPFYMLFAHQGYLAQYHFFRQRFGESSLKAFWHVYVNHLRFGQVIIDRFAVFGGKKFKFEIEGFQAWQDLERQDAGFVQLSSHTGNYELVGYSMAPERKEMYALVFLGETQTVMQNRQRVFSMNNIHMVPVMPDMSHIFELNTALSDGHIVSVPGDRIFGSAKSVNCRFMGQEARFPVGGLSLAVARGCEALAVFSMKEDWQTYRIYIADLTRRVKELQPEAMSKKSTYLQALADNYADELEKIVRRYPTQWFNYYEFWDV